VEPGNFERCAYLSTLIYQEGRGNDPALSSRVAAVVLFRTCGIQDSIAAEAPAPRTQGCD
jgi:hypothetical protein